MTNEADWSRLGEVVVRDRVKAGMKTTKALAERMGRSPRLVGDIENGRRTSYSSSTKVALEQALGWWTGAVEAVLRGGEPGVRSELARVTIGPMGARQPDDPPAVAEVRMRLAVTSEALLAVVAAAA